MGWSRLGVSDAQASTCQLSSCSRLWGLTLSRAVLSGKNLKDLSLVGHVGRRWECQGPIPGQHHSAWASCLHAVRGWPFSSSVWAPACLACRAGDGLSRGRRVVISVLSHCLFST